MDQQQQQNIQPVEAREYFITLDQLLQTTPLPTGNKAQPTRTADCFEFMLMGYTIKGNSIIVSFKHTISRNYLKLDYSNRVLYFNSNGHAFNLGIFPDGERGEA